MTPNKLAVENLKHLCAIVGASYSPDHVSFSPLGMPTYPGPWIRFVLNDWVYYISAGLIQRTRPGFEHNFHNCSPLDRTCFYAHPSVVDIPMAEKVASALLLLRNNPAIFDEWVRRNGPRS